MFNTSRLPNTGSLLKHPTDAITTAINDLNFGSNLYEKVENPADYKPFYQIDDDIYKQVDPVGKVSEVSDV